MNRLVRQEGYWPFVRETRRRFEEIADVVEATIDRKKDGGTSYLTHQVRLIFIDGEEWTILEESYRNDIRRWGERIAQSAELSLTSS